MPALASDLLAQYLCHYGEILAASRDLVQALEGESCDALESCQDRRQKAMDSIDALGPVPDHVAGTLEPALTPVIAEIRRLDARAEQLLQGCRVRLLAQVAEMAPISPESHHHVPLDVARFLDLSA
ncbi:MAG: hypothetical protein HY660_03905 [Armatimonadetes bacterium]|nr:hypothetical protein [Armatimonadota bacterium]